jgi:hypothetical protein
MCLYLPRPSYCFYLSRPKHIAANGWPHAEVAASNIAEVLGCQAESSELDRTILPPTHSPSGNLGRGFGHPAWGCCATVNQASYHSLTFFARVFLFFIFFVFYCIFLFSAAPFN